jgi:transcriptional regulator with XRE-family HTH domain
MRIPCEVAMIEPTLQPNGPKIKALRLAKRWSQEHLAEKVGRNVRTIQNAERGKQRIQEAILKRIADALGCHIDEIVIADNELAGSEPDLCQPGTPAFYLRAIAGEWIAKTGIDAGSSQPVQQLAIGKLEWDVELVAAEGIISGACNCRTRNHEHERFLVSGTVNGRGFVMIDGVRAVADGADNIFRALMQFQSDGRSRTMRGGYVMYWSKYQSMFVGLVEALRIDEKPDESGATPERRGM